jgi:ABC-type nitrate/sulfonate/bicarbonate transport system ATPase subunit
VGFLVSLIAGERLVILDEAFSGLDAHLKLKCYDLIKDYRDKLGKSFLLVSHDIHEIFILSDRVISVTSSKLNHLKQWHCSKSTQREFTSDDFIKFNNWVLDILNKESSFS